MARKMQRSKSFETSGVNSGFVFDKTFNYFKMSLSEMKLFEIVIVNQLEEFLRTLLQDVGVTSYNSK